MTSSLPPDSPDPAREIKPFRPAGLAAFPDPALPSIGEISILGALLADAKNLNTERARLYDVTVLGSYLGAADPAEAATLLCSGTVGQANAVALGFKRYLLDLGHASGTVNRRLCTLRKLVTLARRLGVVDWFLDVEGLPDETYRDTSGPGHDGWKKILALATTRADSGSARGLQGLALIRLMHDNGLRIGEVVALDLADLDLAGLRVNVVGKGKRERAFITINAATAAALAAWTARRGDWPGPAFPALSRSGRTRGDRMVSRGVYRIVRELGKAAGVECRPHGLRHAGATRLLDLTGGDVRAVQKWTRHKSVETVLKYDDNRQDKAGDLARKLGEDD
jgi:integrase/recombinase XerC